MPKHFSLWTSLAALQLKTIVITHSLSGVAAYLIDVADSEKEGGGTDSGVSSIGETVREQISEGGKGFNVPEIEFQEYKV